MPNPWVVIGCGKAKRSTPAPAAELYTSSYITCAVHWARSVTTENHLLILSAKYGLIPGTRIIAPYDTSFLRDSPEPPIRISALAKQIAALGLEGQLITLAGIEYRRRLFAASRGNLLPYNPFFSVLDRLGHNHKQGYQTQQFNLWHGRIPPPPKPREVTS